MARVDLRILSGGHVGPDGILYPPGSIVNEDEQYLTSFPDKYELAGEPAPKKAKAKKAKPPAETAGTVSQESAPAKTDSAAPEGGDPKSEVTDQYPTAADFGLRIFAVGRTFFVEDSDGKPMTEKPLTKTKLEAYLASLA